MKTQQTGKLLTLGEYTGMRAFVDLAQKVRYGDILMLDENIAKTMPDLKQNIDPEPAVNYTFSYDNWRYDDIRNEGNKFSGEISLSYKSRKHWSAKYEGEIKNPDLAEKISYCIKRARSFPNPSLLLFGPSKLEAANGFFYYNIYDGCLDEFIGFEHIFDPKGFCVCSIEFIGGISES